MYGAAKVVRVDNCDLSGLYLVRKDSQVVVHAMGAAAAGLWAADELVGVDNANADELSMVRLRQRFCADGSGNRDVADFPPRAETVRCASRSIEAKPRWDFCLFTARPPAFAPV
jgi:hypothetical protein